MIPNKPSLFDSNAVDNCTPGLTTPPPCGPGVPCDDPEICAEQFDAQCIIYTGDDLICQGTTVIAQDTTVAQSLTNIIDWVCGGGAVGSQGVQGIQGLKGVQGTDGIQGLTGAQGQIGVTGSQGAIGSTGAQGIAGPQGTVGAVGSQGAIGSQGVQGTTGPQGTTGNNGSQGTTGIQGSQGVQGERGLTGNQGIQGITGIQGTTGIQGSIGTQGSTGAQGTVGAQGSQGTQGLLGTQGATGNTGSQGSTGSTGSQGAVGTQGSTGITGSQGIQGTQGIIGSQGTTGIQGSIGSQGTTGTNGAQGATGLQGVQGTIGNTGSQGSTGSTGSQGTAGIQGTTGSTGTQGAIGTTGSQGSVGIQGSTGTTGSQGSTGSTGAQGSVGSQGAVGATGSQGSTGLQGTQGILGTQGSTGATGGTGAQGTQGITGIQGATGTTGGTGSQGATGSQGVTGTQGTQGFTGIGIQGFQGMQGPQGIQGITGGVGIQGFTGSQGIQGIEGIQGIQGIEGLGTQGVQGVQGASGGGGAVAILDEGTTVVATATAINFIGGCVTATDAGGGQADITLKCGCDYEYTKIASSSGYINSSGAESLFSAYTGNGFDGYTGKYYTFSPAISGNPLSLQVENLNHAIPCPIDLFPGDVIKFCGNVYYSGDCVTKDVVYAALSHFECPPIKTNLLKPIIPAQEVIYTYQSITEAAGCFSFDRGLNTTYAACETMFVVSFSLNQESECERIVKFSWTLDIERYCPDFNPTPNLVARNCCDLLIIEVIPTGSLSVGNFYADDEGNCWEIIAATGDPVDYNRTVDSTYISCEACIEVNPCPNNLVVQSCCLDYPETFTGSLPGLSVNDTFTDTYGFCWTVTAETQAPITGLVTVDTDLGAITCETCIDDNPCPEVFAISDCCGAGIQLYSTAAMLGYSPVDGEVFVDTNGICWTAKVILGGFAVSPNADSVVYATTYASCEACQAANPFNCKEATLFFTLRNCCTGDVEVAEIQWQALQAGDGGTLGLSQIATPSVYECWEIFGWTDAGTATLFVNEINGVYEDCAQCQIDYGCPGFYEVLDCCGVQANKVAYLESTVTNFVDTSNNCWQVVGITVGPATIVKDATYPDCVTCQLDYPC